MSKELSSDYLSINTVKKVMPYSVLYALVQSMIFMVDTVLAGHFLGSDAVAAVALGMPVIGMMISFTAMILQGGYLKLLKYLGRSDMAGYNRIFSVTLTLTVIVDIIFLALCLGATSTLVGICGGAKASAQAVAYGHMYMRTACLMILFFAIGTIFQLTCVTFGYQKDILASTLSNVVVNIIISLIAINLLSEGYKIAGLGIGSAAGSLCQMILAFLIMKRKGIKVKYGFYPLNRENILDALDCVRRGVPSSIDNVLDSACGSVVNNIILSVFSNGTSVLALVAMIKTINSLIRTVGRGTLYAGQSLIGILHGERDNAGICSVFKSAIMTGVSYAAVVAIVIIVLQNPILGFYGLESEGAAHIGLVLIAISGMVAVFPFVFSAVYEATEHLLLSLIVAVLPDSILYPMFVAFFGKRFGITGVWIAMGYSFIPFFIAFYAGFILVNRKLIFPLDRLLLLEKYENRETALDVSIPVSSRSVSFVSERLQRFFLDHDTPPKVAYLSALCMEEIAADYIAHRKEMVNAPDKAYMDIKAFRDPDKIEIILRNYDDPYDPLLIEKDGIDDGSFSKIGIILTQKMASDILYSYAYHLNVVSVIIPTDGTAGKTS